MSKTMIHGSGDPVNASQMVGERAFLIEFWATWCPPCLLELPWRTELQSRPADRPGAKIQRWCRPRRGCSRSDAPGYPG